MADVIIGAPTAKATFPGDPAAQLTPQDVIALQAARIRELESDLSAKTVAASTIANIASCLVRIYGDQDRVTVPRATSDRMRGSQLTVSENVDGDIEVFARDIDAHAPIATEG